MSTLTETKPWDLSHVLEFHNALSPLQQGSPRGQEPSHPVNGAKLDQGGDKDNDGGVSLGSFGKIWQFLGTPAPATANAPRASVTQQTDAALVSKLDYTSDGAAYNLTRGGAPRIQRHPSFTDGTDGEDLWLGSSKPAHNGAPMTKTQKKRMRRKERRDQEIAQVRLNGGRADAISESEPETAGRKTPARKASAHVMKDKSKEVETQLVASKLAKSAKEIKDTKATSGPSSVPLKGKPVEKRPASRLDKHKQEVSTDEAVNAVAAAMAALKTGATRVSFTPTSGKEPTTPTQTKRLPVAQSQPAQRMHYQTPPPVSKLQLVPASVGVQPKIGSQPAGHAPMQIMSGINPTAVALSMHVPTAPGSARKPRQQPVIEPKIIRSGEDRHWALLMKLINEFGEDRKHLVAPMNMTTHNNDPQGIHIFVDASNICIGFMDMLKSTRGIHPMAHLPQANLSFDGLALLMERRRPVAKRVLAGSNPWLPAFDKAKAIGYEMNIFEKVYKARELTDRQLFFQQQDARRYSKGSKAPPVHTSASLIKLGSSPPVYSVLGHGSGSGSGTETSTTPQYAPAKMIEQGVDEILHLKMMESIVDYEVPSTMVLATGDAAQAEYSQGFMAMAERALKKGWTVELISWSKNISKAYLKSNWTGAWDGRFKIIYLDDFAEELLDM